MNWKSLTPTFDAAFKASVAIPKAYAAILFLQNPVAGAIIMSATMMYPNIGLAGLLAALVAFSVTRWWQFPDYAGQIQIFNSLLVGLSLGAFYLLNLYVIGIIILAAILTTFTATVLADWFWRLDRVPVLSLPFIMIAGLMAIVARHYTELSDFMGLTESTYSLFLPAIDNFFSALGAIFFTPQPIMGLILFGIILFYSRYLAMLAIAGYITGYLLLTALLFEPHQGFIIWTGFNFILVALALGGIYTIPGIASFVFALVGVLVSVLLVVVTQNLLLVEGLPVMAIAFVATALLMIVAMKKRLGLVKPWLAAEPGLPEINYEKARLAKFRNGDINSVPLLAPVQGQWTIYQGFNGKHTHKAPWHYALDFFITKSQQQDNPRVSFQNSGDKLEDYFCYGAPVLSPVYGTVVRVFDKLPDNTPGDVDTKNNWGNFILVRLQSGLHVLLAHLQQDSIKVKENDLLQPGMVIAACGNSGRSPQPHLHMQVQQTAELGSATYPFHLCSTILHKADGMLEYQVISQPQEGDLIEASTTDDQLAHQLHLPVGRQLCYQFSESTSPDEATQAAKGVNETTLTVELTLLGQFRLCSDKNASTAFEEANGVLAFYDRKGPKDKLLDMWLLANGLTPLSAIAHHWRDAPSAMLLPMTLVEKIALWILHPLGCGLQSEYTRQWDEAQLAWIQRGKHQLKLGTRLMLAETNSIIDPTLGCKQITLKFANLRWQAQLVESGLIEDRGIPHWDAKNISQQKSNVSTDSGMRHDFAHN